MDAFPSEEMAQRFHGKYLDRSIWIGTMSLMISEEVIANVIKNRTDIILNDEKISTREKLTRIDEITIITKDIQLWGEVESVYNELSESEW